MPCVACLGTLSVPRQATQGNYTYYDHFGFVPLDAESLKRNSTFLMLLKRADRMRRHKLRWYGFSKDRMEQLVLEIDKELERLQ